MQLHHEFIKTAKKNGKRIAIIDRTLGRRVSYSKALIGALILSKKFKAYQEGFIGVMIPNSAGSILSTLGIVISGRVPVMINYSTGAADNCEYAQQKCGFKTIITSRALLEKIGCRLVPGMVFIEDIMAGISAKDKIGAALQTKLPTGVLLKKVHQGEPDDNAVILFTSGSEKDPKAVQLTHRNFISNIDAILTKFKITKDDIMLGILPLFHVFGHNTNFWLPLYFGMSVVTYANPLEYEKVCQIIKEEKVTIMLATPVFFMGYLRKSKPGDFETVWLAVAGADKLPEWLRKSFVEKHNLELFEGYGATETSPVVSVNGPGENKPGSIGLPLGNVQVKITDIDSGEVLGTGQEGKIEVKGDLIMKGYFDDIEETSLRIEAGWYDTGDMGLIDDDGYLWHKGRLKRFVKIGGEMVSLVRVESELNGFIADDIDYCVVEVPDSLKGARIVVALTKEINTKEIINRLSGKLPKIAIPSQFVLINELPKMGSGKVDFRTVTDLVKKKLSRNNSKSK
jgi:acyl-[acyl-carrier-protein]-phospholipid O-acyltransferase/long-chain-fatty-acid--[acyl-carrier-protein] ligase